MSRQVTWLEWVARPLIWSLVVSLLLGPVILILLLSRAGVPFPPFAQKPKPQPPLSSIVTGESPRQRAAQIARLKSFTTLPELASGSRARLRLVGVDFDPTLPAPRDADGYRHLTIDLSQTPGDAVVVISRQPVRWTV